MGMRYVSMGLVVIAFVVIGFAVIVFAVIVFVVIVFVVIVVWSLFFAVIVFAVIGFAVILWSWDSSRVCGHGTGGACGHEGCGMWLFGLALGNVMLVAKKHIEINNHQKLNSLMMYIKVK